MSSGHYPSNLFKALSERQFQKTLIKLHHESLEIDFCSNDYLGFSKEGKLKNKLSHFGSEDSKGFGATGSRLVSGNSQLAEEAEKQIALFHHAPSALLFNSGYLANLGLLSCVPQKTDLVLYDEMAHTSIYDGIRLGQATHYKFAHNNIDSIEELVLRHRKSYENIFIVVESVYSMNGETAPLLEIVELIKPYKNLFLIVDEAHALGVFGNQGRGLCNALAIEKYCFARMYAFGKAMGCFGSAIVGNEILKSYLVNFSRPFAYTTSLPQINIQAILSAYQLLLETNEKEKLQNNIAYFYSKTSGIKSLVRSQSAVQSIILESNEQVDALEKAFSEKNIRVRKVKSPQIKTGSERIKICLHSFNSREEIDLLVEVLAAYKKPIQTRATFSS